MMLSIKTAREVQQSLGDALRRARRQRKHGREEAARRSGVPAPTIRRFESTGEISLRQFLMLCEVYGDPGKVEGAFPLPGASTMDELIANSRVEK